MYRLSVYHNPFVTQASLDKRREFLAASKPTEPVVPEKDFNQSTQVWSPVDVFTPVSVVYGSIARGDATVNSDIDGLIIHGVEGYGRDHFNFRICSVTEFPKSTRELSLFAVRDIGMIPPIEVMVFCPAIGEFNDSDYSSDIEKAIYQYRKLILTAIANQKGTHYSPEEIWNHVRDRLDKLLLPNLTNRRYAQLDQKNRNQRLGERRYELIGKHGTRANKYFELFDKISFPDWDTMKLAFDVVEIKNS